MNSIVKPPAISADELRRLLDYCPETGRLVWVSDVRRGWMGKIAGSPKDGYLEVGIQGVSYRIHRVIWAIATGEWPPEDKDIDHINGDRADNRWQNLRLATRSENIVNRTAARADSKTGVRGIRFCKARKKYLPIVRENGMPRRLGRFSTLEEAVAVRGAWMRERYGEFAP